MRVVDVTQWYAPESGGIRTYLHAKAEWAARANADHAAVVTGEEPGEIRVADSPFVVVPGRTAGRWGYRPALRSIGILAALERLRPDVLVLNDALSFPRRLARWARERDLPLAMRCHSDLAMATAGLSPPLAGAARPLLGRIQRRAMQTPALVLAASQEIVERVDTAVGGRLVLAPLGVDLARFGRARSDPALRRQLAPRGQRLLVHVGRLSSEKRVDLLPAMLAALGGDAVLAVAGAGAYAPRLQRLAWRAGVADRLVLLGHVHDRDRLAGLLATADCTVFPNPAEPFGLAVLEALAAGSRVVAADAAGPREVAVGRGVTLVTPGDARALANGVRTALARPRRRPDMSGLSWTLAFEREWDCYRALVAGETGDRLERAA